MPTDPSPSKPSFLAGLKISLERLSNDLDALLRRLEEYERDLREMDKSRQHEALERVKKEGELGRLLDALGRDVADASKEAASASEAVGRIQDVVDAALAPVVKRVKVLEEGVAKDQVSRSSLLWQAGVAFLGLVGAAVVSAWLNGLFG